MIILIIIINGKEKVLYHILQNQSNEIGCELNNGRENKTNGTKIRQKKTNL